MEKGIKYVIGNQDVDTSFLALEMTWKGMRDERLKEQIGICSHDSVCEIVKGNTINYLVEAKGIKVFIDRCVEKILKDERLLPRLKRETEKVARQIQNLARSSIKRVRALSQPESITLLREIDKLQAECVFWGTVVAFADLWGDVTNRLLKVVQKRKNLKYSIPTYTSILTLPKEKGLTQRAYDDIVQSQKSYKELLQEYFWLDQGYIGRGLTEDQLGKIKASHKEQKGTANRRRTFI